MPDPLSIVLAAGAAGGAAGKFVERVWNSGEKWLLSYFADHQPDVIENARNNSGAFLANLAERVEQLEGSNPYNKEFFSKAFKEPSFSVLLQKAILNSAQTSRPEKHALLAKLVADKIQAGEESLHSLASQMACDAIAFATLNQLKILGICTALVHIIPSFIPTVIDSEQKFLDACESSILARMAPFLDTVVSQLDLGHLEALSCLKNITFSHQDLNQAMSNWKCGVFTFSTEKLYSMSIGKQIKAFWEEKGLRSVTLTTVGQLVGVYAVDTFSKSNTSLANWGNA